MTSLLINGTAFHIPLADKSVHLICTSPPYFNLRRYEGITEWVDGDKDCDHIDEIAKAERERNRKGLTKNANLNDGGERSVLIQNGIDKAFQYNGVCGKCGAVNADNQFGLEPTIALYTEHTMMVLDECWRVLRDDGVLFFNIGDSYAGNRSYQVPDSKHKDVGNSRGMKAKELGVKPKDMCLVPERIAISAQERGWYVRSRIAWKKDNVMPSSVRDRPTVDSETIWLFTKSERYYWDWYAVREKSVTGKWDRLPPIGGKKQTDGNDNPTYSGNQPSSDGYRNMRSTWNVNTSQYSGSHFAVFPPEIPERCILTSPEKVCEICGSPWERVIEKKANGKVHAANDVMGVGVGYDTLEGKRQNRGEWQEGVYYETTGWRPTCTCCPNTVFHLHCDEGIEKDHADCRDCMVSKSIVLDPFVGSGTTVAKAIELGRIGIGMDLSMKYLVENAKKRIEAVQPRMMALG